MPAALEAAPQPGGRRADGHVDRDAAPCSAGTGPGPAPRRVDVVLDAARRPSARRRLVERRAAGAPVDRAHLPGDAEHAQAVGTVGVISSSRTVSPSGSTRRAACPGRAVVGRTMIPRGRSSARARAPWPSRSCRGSRRRAAWPTPSGPSAPGSSRPRQHDRHGLPGGDVGGAADDLCAARRRRRRPGTGAGGRRSGAARPPALVPPGRRRGCRYAAGHAEAVDRLDQRAGARQAASPAPPARRPGSTYSCQPGQRHPHANCSRTRRSPSKSMRRSGTPWRIMARRSRPQPNAKPCSARSRCPQHSSTLGSTIPAPASSKPSRRPALSSVRDLHVSTDGS